MTASGAATRLGSATRRHVRRALALGLAGALAALALPFGILGSPAPASAIVSIPTCWAMPSGGAPSADPDSCAVTDTPAAGGAGTYTITITHKLNGQRCADFGTWPTGCVASEYTGMGTGDSSTLNCPFYSGPAGANYLVPIDSSQLPEGQFTCTVTLSFDGLNASEAGFTDNVWQQGREGTVFFLGYKASPPSAGINYHATGAAPNQWVFDGSPSTPGSGATSITSYAWNFGDGTSTTVTTPTVTHSFASEGDKTVTLTVTDTAGQTATASTTLGPALSITQITHAPASIAAGSSFTESVTVQNQGPTTITGVTPSATVVDPTIATLAAGWAPASATIAPGMAATFTIGGTGVKTGSTTVSASAAGTAGGQTITAATRTAALAVAGAELSLTLVDPPATLSTTTPSTLKVLVTALGSQGATGVTVAAPVKIAGSGDGDIRVLSGPTGADVGFTLPTQGATRTVSFQVEAATAGAFGYTVGVTGTDTATAAATSASVNGTVSSPTLIVTTNGDQALTSDQLAANVCDVDAATAGNQCTLRAALQLAAARGDAETIDFDIPGGGVPTIAPASALPTATSPVTIDGTSQPGGWVVLSGAADASGTGLVVTGGDSTIRGMVVDGWQTGIELSGAGGDLVADNRIGTDASGTTIARNHTGIRLLAPNSTIGQLTGGSIGQCDGGCNVIAGNNIDIEAGSSGAQYAAGSRIVGNVIGADTTGSVRLSPAGQSPAVGIDFAAPLSAGAVPPIQIGGITSRAGLAPGNLIDADVGIATAEGGQLSAAEVIGEGNLFGADWADTHGIGQQFGISDSASMGQWGDPAAGAGNVIVFDTVAGADEGGIYVNDRFGLGVTGQVQPDARGTEGRSVDLCGDVVSGNPIGTYGFVELLGGNRIGTDPTGETAIPNGVGVVGGVQSTAPEGISSICAGYGPDVISGNTTAGVQPGLNPVVLVHVYIGTDATGMHAIPNGVGILQVTGHAGEAFDVGVPLRDDPRPCASRCVLISGNTGPGISYAANDPGQAAFGSPGNLGRIAIAHSGIGVAIDGSALPNGGDAIALSGPITSDEAGFIAPTGIVDNLLDVGAAFAGINLGGATLATTSGLATDYFPVAGNTVVGAGSGVALGSGTGFRVDDNAFTGVGLPISVTSGTEPDLSGNSYTSAHGGYSLLGPVARTAVPTSIAVARVGSTLVAAGTLTGTRDLHVRIDAYASSTCTATDSTPLGSAMLPIGVTSDFSVTTPLPTGKGLQLTATDLDGAIPTLTASAGNTSAYTACVSLAALPTLSAASVAAGGSVTLTAPGFVAGESTGLTLHSVPVALGTATADPTGLVTGTVTIPADTPVGIHRILVTDAAGLTVTVPLTVTAAATSVVTTSAATTTGSLAATGTSTGSPLAAALALIVIGGAIRILVALRRRRRPGRAA